MSESLPHPSLDTRAPLQPPVPNAGNSVQLRSEHSRSIADGEKYKALSTLRNLGLLVPLEDISLYHGRGNRASEGQYPEWEVDPAYDNVGNVEKGRGRNVNNRPSLYASDIDTAQDFADAGAGFDRDYWIHLLDKVANYTDEENVARLQRQNDWLRKLWEESVSEGRLDPETTQPDAWTMEELLNSNSVLEVRYLLENTSREEFEEFKKRYATEKRAEIHKIVASDTDATVLDFRFNPTNLDNEQKKAYYEALESLVIPLTDGSPVGFEDRDKLLPIMEAANALKRRFYTEDDIHHVAEETGVSLDTVRQLMSAQNAKNLARRHLPYLVSELLSKSDDIANTMIQVDDEHVEIPLNLEYVQRLLRRAHIVGAKHSVDSMTLGREVKTYSLFDLERVSTEQSRHKKISEIGRKLGSIATLLETTTSGDESRLKTLLSDPHVKAHDLIAAVKEIGNFEEIMELDSGTWEGFSLEEHTETVLNNFEENFADVVPVELLPTMRLILITHDIGKSVASYHGKKKDQHLFNEQYASKFMSMAGIDPRLNSLIISIIGDGSKLAHSAIVRSDAQALARLGELAKKAMQDYKGVANVSESEIKGYVEMCKMLQLCDGGAYTSMAVTRNTKAPGRYRNAPSFNTSFRRPVGFGKRSIRLREGGDAAPTDLTPKQSENPSRVRISKRGNGRRTPVL